MAVSGETNEDFIFGLTLPFVMFREIKVDEDVKRYILSQKQDFRVCTACSGPALVPITVKEPKKNDIMVPIGDYVLYVSAVQAMYINRVTMDMLYSDEDIETCYAFNRGKYY